MPLGPENYRVPLLVIGEGIGRGVDDMLRSHLDLQAIVAHYLIGAQLPAARDRVVVVGHTGRWVYGEVVPPSDYLFIDERTGRILNRRGSLEPADVHQRLQAQIDPVDGIRPHP